MKQYGPFSLLFLFLLLRPLAAHELWLAPLQWQVKPGEDIRVAVQLGSGFSGSQQIYMPAAFSRFDLAAPSGLSPVAGRMGDRPAGQATPVEEGLHLLLYETTPRLVRYDHLDDFAAFAEEKGYPEARNRHRALGLPETGFNERYTRHAKSLIAVGTSAIGHDQPVGMAVEFIALANPYGWREGPLAFRLEVDGLPRPGARVKVMHRATGAPDAPARSINLETDDAGMFRFQPVAGHVYLLDHVALMPVAETAALDSGAAVWLSRWGSLTFLVPGP